jgi:hypothetical protein
VIAQIRDSKKAIQGNATMATLHLATSHFQPDAKPRQPLLATKTPVVKQANLSWQTGLDTVHFGHKPTDNSTGTENEPVLAQGSTEQDKPEQEPIADKKPSLMLRLTQGAWKAAKTVGYYAFVLPFVWMGKLALKPFEKLQPKARLKNAVDNAIGYPRHQKLVKAGIWAGATFAIGCIPIPGFQALIAAAPVTFLTTLLVDFAVGFFDGLTKDPEKMREYLDNWKKQA